MRPLDAEILAELCPHTPRAQLEPLVRPLASTFIERAIVTLDRAACFLAQYAHETEGFTRFEENLRYTHVEALMAAYKPRWDALDPDEAWGYLNQPERLANRVYANRMGNGDEASGDGWRFRGRGLPHLTGRKNYGFAGPALDLDLLGDPDQLLQPLAAVRAGGWYWHECGGNQFADRGDFEGLTHAINGGHNGLAERKAYLKRAREVLA